MSRLITFDITNTLLQLRVSPGAHYAAVADQLGLRVSAPRADAAFRRQFRAQWEQQPNFGRGRPAGWRGWWTQLVTSVLAEAGPPDRRGAAAVADRLLEDYATERCWRVAEGAVPLLRRLSSAEHVTLGVISNFDPRLHSILQSLQLRHFFHFVIASYEHPCCKPDAGIFAVARRAVGADPPAVEECTHVGDSLELDYRAARAAGWRAVLLDGGGAETAVEPADVCTNLSDLENVLLPMKR